MHSRSIRVLTSYLALRVSFGSSGPGMVAQAVGRPPDRAATSQWTTPPARRRHPPRTPTRHIARPAAGQDHPPGAPPAPRALDRPRAGSGSRHSRPSEAAPAELTGNPTTDSFAVAPSV